MTGEGSSCTESGLPGPTDGQPQEEATWQDRVVVKRSSLGFISKMLLGWQEHSCPPQQWPTEAPRPWVDFAGEAGAVGLFSGLGNPS